MKIVKFIEVLKEILVPLFFWKAGKDHEENKRIKSTLKSIDKINRARRNADKRARVREKFFR